MKREGDVIRFDDDEGDVQNAFERELSGAEGADIFMERLLAGFASAGYRRELAWKRMLARVRGAGLITHGEHLVWHRDGEKFTVFVDKARPASRRNLQDILTDLEAAKLEAVGEKCFSTAAFIRDAADSLRSGLRLTSEADAPADTATTGDKGKDADK